MDRIPMKKNPRLFDKVFADIQKQLGSKLTWLDHVFGLCESLTEEKEGRRFKSANVYIGNGNYEQIMPCEELGNFCFFMLQDPQERLGEGRNTLTAPFYAVFWYNVDQVSSSADGRNREAVKEDILGALNTLIPRIEWTAVYERPENIFKDFSYDFVGNQFLMSPYSGLRIEGRVRVTIPCWYGLCGDFNDDFNEDYDNEGNCKSGAFGKDFGKDFG